VVAAAARRLARASGRSPGEGGLLALSVGLGLGVLAELLEQEVDDVVGPKGRHSAGAARSVTDTSRAS
jgi:hypothetical protein